MTRPFLILLFLYVVSSASTIAAGVYYFNGMTIEGMGIALIWHGVLSAAIAIGTLILQFHLFEAAPSTKLDSPYEP